MTTKHKTKKPIMLLDLLERKVRKINRRSDRLTKRNINDLMDTGVSRLEYPEPDTVCYKNADF